MKIIKLIRYLWIDFLRRTIKKRVIEYNIYKNFVKDISRDLLIKDYRCIPELTGRAIELKNISKKIFYFSICITVSIVIYESIYSASIVTLFFTIISLSMSYFSSEIIKECNKNIFEFLQQLKEERK
jgi:hypothetical protein